MSIAILPARLANQIAAGEVVERPASVIKELVENSLDAGATSIHIDIDKGGIKKIKITDNGHGIAKDELMLALSRHATSKIKDLSDLEAINSLGFRGEALASISSVSRLTLTSKPKDQPTAWQAIAEGRDMLVDIKPAAHPDGTSIEVLDLFFNTPARRKFLRTEKTEFNHIDEVIRRIALAHFDVSFTLTHNGNTVRQYRTANTHAQSTKRVASVCGNKFIEHALEIDCTHDNMKLSGWLGKPSFSRNQNDLTYSYVNGRMMRDKLINHAIRQAYADLLPTDTYPAFVLFLELEHKEVDVNVHPSKHEVRFHQSRYVHDFIYSVCNKALISALSGEELFNAADNDVALVQEKSYSQLNSELSSQQKIPQQVSSQETATQQSTNNGSVSYPRADYVTPLQQVNDGTSFASGTNNSSNHSSINNYAPHYGSEYVSKVSAENYQALMTPHNDLEKPSSPQSSNEESFIKPLKSSHNQVFLISVQQPGFALYKGESEVRVLSLFKLARDTYSKLVEQSWQPSDGNEQESLSKEGLVSQPLLLPVRVKLSDKQYQFALAEQELLIKAGIIFVDQGKNKIQIRQFPALLREQDVHNAFICIIDECIKIQDESTQKGISKEECYQALGMAMVLAEYDEISAESLIKLSAKLFNAQLSQQLLLNSVPLDLTSHINQLL